MSPSAISRASSPNSTPPMNPAQLEGRYLQNQWFAPLSGTLLLRLTDAAKYSAHGRLESSRRIAGLPRPHP